MSKTAKSKPPPKDDWCPHCGISGGGHLSTCEYERFKPGASSSPQPRLREAVAAFVERCEELRNGSPNAFYMHVDAFCKSMLAAPDPLGEAKNDEEFCAKRNEGVSAAPPVE